MNRLKSMNSFHCVHSNWVRKTRQESTTIRISKFSQLKYSFCFCFFPFLMCKTFEWLLVQPIRTTRRISLDFFKCHGSLPLFFFLLRSISTTFSLLFSHTTIHSNTYVGFLLRRFLRDEPSRTKELVNSLRCFTAARR